MSYKHETEWYKDRTYCETCGYYETGNLTTTPSAMTAADDVLAIRVPKKVACITICGAVRLNIDDTMSFTKPTQEQIKNLRETFCIDVELFD